MIGKLKGMIEQAGADSVIIDVGGVGYLVFCSGRTLRQLNPGRESTLFIETHVREDHIHLFGFSAEEERLWFKQLQTVSGVGAKVALAVLSALSPDQLITAIASQDKAAFKAVAGVGPKLAERILVELKSKVSGLSIVPKTGGGVATESAGGEIADAISALINLGYNRSEAYGAVQKAAQANKTAKVSDLIRLGLKELAS
jgi:Holliday junction DNA helicase RuvA